MSRDRWLNLERSMAKQNADRFLRAPSAENMKMGKKEVLIGKRMGWDRGFWVLRVFKLDHLQPIKPNWSWKFSHLFTIILQGQLLLPQRANNGTRGFIQPLNWVRQRVFGAWCIQIGPYAPHWAYFVEEDFQLFHFHTGRLILITPVGQ